MLVAGEEAGAGSLLSPVPGVGGPQCSFTPSMILLPSLPRPPALTLAGEELHWELTGHVVYAGAPRTPRPHSVLPSPGKGAVIIPISQMRKPRLREVE